MYLQLVVASHLLVPDNRYGFYISLYLLMQFNSLLPRLLNLIKIDHFIQRSVSIYMSLLTTVYTGHYWVSAGRISYWARGTKLYQRDGSSMSFVVILV